MKSVNLKQLCKLALVPLALCLSTGLGKAQDAYKGNFTLPFEARWQKAVLPAGNYTLNMHSTAAPYTLFVRGEGKSVIITGLSGDPEAISEKSRLTLVRVGDTYVVRSLDAGQIGLNIDYPVGSGKATHMAAVSVPVELASTGK